MPITSDTTTVAQYKEAEAKVDLVTNITVNPSAELLLCTDVGQNDNRMTKQSFIDWIAGTGLNTTGGALNVNPGVTSTDMTITMGAGPATVQSGSGATDTIDLAVPSGAAGLISGTDLQKLVDLPTGGANTDMLVTMSPGAATVRSGTGATDTIDVVVSSGNAGLMTGLQAQELENLVATPPANTDAVIVMGPGAASVQIGSGAVDNIELVNTTNNFAGLMTAADKTKLDSIEPGAINYVHPNHTGEVTSTGDGAQVITDGAVTTVKIADANVTLAKLAPDAVTNLGNGAADPLTVVVTNSTGTDVTLPAATDTTAGVLTAADKAKIDASVAYVHPDHTGEVTSTSDGAQVITDGVVTTVKLADANVTLAKLAPDAITNLGNGTPDPNIVTVTNSTGTDVDIPAATTTEAGVMTSAGKTKLDDIVFVTDFGADPTGSTSSSAAIQAALDYAEANLIGTVKFPKGEYRMDTGCTLPQGTEGSDLRMTLDFGGSKLWTGNDIVMFSRTTAASTIDWMYTLRDGTFTSTTRYSGTAFQLDRTARLAVHNIRGTELGTFLNLRFALASTVSNVNLTNMMTPIVVDEIDANSKSNMSNWINVRCQLIDPAAVGFDINNALAVTLNQCTCEGSAALTGFRFGGDETSYTMNNCWSEWSGGDGTLGQCIELHNMDRGHFSCQTYLNNIPNDGMICKTTGVTRSVITFRDMSGFSTNRIGHLVPWFDPDIDASPGNNNHWRFLRCYFNDSTLFNDPQRWVGGVVPQPLYEDTWQPSNNDTYDTHLTIDPNALLGNQDGANNAKVKPVTEPGLTEGNYTAGNFALGWNDAGDLAKFELSSIAASTSRKDGIDDLGNNSTGLIAVDFDSQTFDNVQIELGADVSTFQLATTRIGYYEVWIKQDATGFRKLETGVGSDDLAPRSIRLAINPDSNQVTVIRLYYDGTVWNWG